jgi:hypothetical protein
VKRRTLIPRVPGAARREAKRNDAQQTRDRSGPWRSRIGGAPLHFVEFILGPREARTRGRCTASGTRGIERREFIALLAGAGAAAWPLAARAQQGERVRRIGVLMAHPKSDPEFQTYLASFQEGLQKLGWAEGRNIQIDARWGALDDAEARQRSGKELLALRPEELSPVDVRDAGEIERAVTGFAQAAPARGSNGLIVTSSIMAIIHREPIIALAARHRLPAVYSERGSVAAGGLISYGPDRLDQFRRPAGYVDRILKGEKPADLPVQAPTKYQLVVNLKTAKTLGLDIPTSVLARADEVIE